MNPNRLRLFYLFGIVLNLIALAYALADGETLFAPAFVLVIIYLAARYRMVET
ncbi:hypothetical protein OB955_03375 [Halobacteria archaeon AArc-m2/3/4]|uniref:Uncharacterized protein n=1 Tax=Natronoglomus mannanivorans TaxID=2979990 RepID=A0AAP3E067_9EURY|nr:hypothetical protein [Halobacteria archaeon AArc-xg1-1]MCU4971779.1 hypothetical protein [Halobacteria archaeon AArc-m2/3/4]